MALGNIAFRSHGTASISANMVQMWAPEVLLDASTQAFFNPYDMATFRPIGGAEYANAAVLDYTRTLTGPMRGDTVQINLDAHLKGKPRNGVMVGNEEKLTNSNFTLTLARWRHAVGYEQFSQDKSFWDILATIKRLYTPFIKHWKDKRVFDTMVSGTTAYYPNTAAAAASASIAAMATGGMTVSGLDTIGKTLKGRVARPLFFAGGEGGATRPGYAIVMPDDQYEDVMLETSMKSALQLSVSPGPDHPLRSGLMVKYKSLYVFSLIPDYTNGGSPLQPMCKLYTTIPTGTGASVAYVSTSGSAACPTKYFPSSGYLLIYNPGGTKYERIKYKGKGDYSFNLTGKRVAAGRTSHLAASSIVAYEVCRVVGFGAGVVAKVETIDPNWITEAEDYRERLGQGLRWVEGYKKVPNVAGKYPGIVMMHACHDRTIRYLG